MADCNKHEGLRLQSTTSLNSFCPNLGNHHRAFIHYQPSLYKTVHIIRLSIHQIISTLLEENKVNIIIYMPLQITNLDWLLVLTKIKEGIYVFHMHKNQT